MLLIAQFVVPILTFIAVECNNDAEPQNEDKHPASISFGFPIPFFTRYYDRSNSFRNHQHEDEPSMLMTEFERESKDFELDFIKKVLDNESLIVRKNEKLENAERLQTHKIKEYKETKPSNTPSPLSLWNEKRFGENNSRNIKVPVNTHSKETQTDVESAIVFRDDDYDNINMKVSENKQNIAKYNRFSEVSTQSVNQPIKNTSSTEIIKNKDYFMIPITMPRNVIASSTTESSDNANYADKNTQIVQNTQTLTAVPELNLARNIPLQSSNNLVQGVQTKVLPIQYFGVIPQNQGLNYGTNLNVAPNNVNGNGLNNQTNAAFTVLNIPNIAAQAINGNKQQGIVYYLLNQGNGVNSANVPSEYQLVSFPNNNKVSGEGISMVPNNEPMQPPNMQTNLAGTSNQPNYLMFINSPSNNNQATNLLPLNNQVSFQNQPNLLSNNQLNVQAINSMPVYSQVGQALNAIKQNNQHFGQATNSMLQNNQNLGQAINYISIPLNNQANLAPLQNQQRFFILSNQPNAVTMTSLPNNVVALANQPAVAAFTNPFPNQNNVQYNMALQPNNNYNTPNLQIQQNQPNDLIALLNQVNNKKGINHGTTYPQPPIQSNLLAALNNNQAGNSAIMTNQGNIVGIPENQTPNIYGNILAILANQPTSLTENRAAVPRGNGIDSSNRNNQLGIKHVEPTVSYDAVNHPSLIANGQANHGKEYTLMDTKDEVEA